MQLFLTLQKLLKSVLTIPLGFFYLFVWLFCLLVLVFSVLEEHNTRD